jgi:hypothetical protein
MIAVLTALGIGSPRHAAAQSEFPSATDTALTSDMRLLDRYLLERARAVLERTGNTFFATAMYVVDTTPAVVLEVGPQHYIEQRIPSVHRDSLRSAMRNQFRYEPGRTVGIMVDSIAGPISEAVDGVESPDIPRKAITELEDVKGQCRRIDREYHFVQDAGGDAPFGKVVFGTPSISLCDPLGYWPPPDSSRTGMVSARPHLAAPLVRDLEISSLGVQFVITGEFKGNLTIYDDSIVVKFDRLLATRQLHDGGLVTLDSVRVGVGIGDENSWSPVDDSKALRIGRRLSPDSRIVRRNVRFVLPHQRAEGDDSAWIVVTFHLTRGRRGEPGYVSDATTYAHSERGVLGANREEKKATR